MATSLGYVLMNWTSVFAHKQRKKAKKSSKKVSVTKIEDKCCQIDIEIPCEDCIAKSQQLKNLNLDFQTLNDSAEELRRKLSVNKKSLATSMETELKLRTDHENLILEEAQVRYELDQLRNQLSKNLQERDEAHAERMKLLESTLQDKEVEWAKKNEALRKDLRQAIRSSIQDTEREVESIGNLEQEIESLRMVVDMRSAENRELRIHNNELLAQVERLHYLEAELNNSRHRLDEMSLVLQHKMDSESELLELSETLQNELVKSRAEAMQWKNNVENRQYLQENSTIHQKPVLKVQHSQNDLIHRNQHQQASSGDKDKKNLIMNVREKTESVAWMIQMPTNSPTNQRRVIKTK